MRVSSADAAALEVGVRVEDELDVHRDVLSFYVPAWAPEAIKYLVSRRVCMFLEALAAVSAAATSDELRATLLLLFYVDDPGAVREFLRSVR